MARMSPDDARGLLPRGGEPVPAPALVAALGPGETRKEGVASVAAAARERVAAAHGEGQGGQAVVALWTGLVDHLVAALFHAILRDLGGSPDRLALVALGGYGRGELSPCSDLDLLVLHDDGGDLTPLVEGLLYPLWDAGFDVQAVARTVGDNIRAARQDVRSRTSLLEARLLTGGRDLWEEMEQRVVREEILGREVDGFIRAKVAEMEARHRRYGDTVYVLEPHLKEGEGGLRDIHTAYWVSKVRFGARTLGELAREGRVPQAEIAALEEARDFLLRVRNHLHLRTGRREDRLTFEHQDEAAPFFGFDDRDGIPGVERFLQAYHASARRVRHFSRTVIRRSLSPSQPRRTRGEAWRDPGVWFHDGQVFLEPERVEEQPIVLLAAFEAAQHRNAELSPQALEVVREHLGLVDDRFRRDPEAVERFLRILRHPRRVTTTLMAMHEVGLLDRFIPEFGRIHGRAQRDLYHIYPVDVHSLFAVQELRRLARGEYEEEHPLLTALIHRVRHRDILYLAALLHDVGKGAGGGHERRGAEMALAVADRMDLDPVAREYLVFLVGNHLLLSHTAQGRDLHDPDLIADFCARVGDLESLDLLYLLTFADIRAVGPGAWTGWKNLLFRELYERARGFLESGGRERPRGEDPERVREVASRIREVVAGRVGAEHVDAFLEGVGQARYLLANPVEALVRHLEAFAERDREPVVRLREVPEEDYAEVILVTRDRPGLFARVAGVMAAHRLNILSAVLNSRPDGWVIDVFHLSPARPEPARWERCRRTLEGVIRGEISFSEAVEPKLRRRPALRRYLPRTPVRVAVDNEASRRFTVVEVRAADRLGLLYDVARVLAGHGLTIQIAKIATNIHQVADAFYVETVQGGKLTDPARIAALEQDLEAVLAPREEGTGGIEG